MRKVNPDLEAGSVARTPAGCEAIIRKLNKIRFGKEICRLIEG